MTTVGTVRKTENGMASVEVIRRAMCDGCPNNSVGSTEDKCGHSCAMGALLGNSKNMTVTVENKVNAKIGDKVELETSDKTVLFSAFLVFVFPLVLAGICYGLASYLNLSDGVKWICAAVGFAFSLVFTSIAEKKAKKDKNRLHITRIVSEA